MPNPRRAGHGETPGQGPGTLGPAALDGGGHQGDRIRHSLVRHLYPVCPGRRSRYPRSASRGAPGTGSMEHGCGPCGVRLPRRSPAAGGGAAVRTGLVEHSPAHAGSAEHRPGPGRSCRGYPGPMRPAGPGIPHPRGTHGRRTTPMEHRAASGRIDGASIRPGPGPGPPRDGGRGPHGPHGARGTRVTTPVRAHRKGATPMFHGYGSFGVSTPGVRDGWCLWRAPVARLNHRDATSRWPGQQRCHIAVAGRGRRRLGGTETVGAGGAAAGDGSGAAGEGAAGKVRRTGDGCAPCVMGAGA